jgi:hypothetical protein
VGKKILIVILIAILAVASSGCGPDIFGGRTKFTIVIPLNTHTKTKDLLGLNATKTMIAYIKTLTATQWTRTQTRTATSTSIPTKTVSPTQTLTPSVTSKWTSFPIRFYPVNFSSDNLFQGAQSCDPKTLTVQVQVTPSDPVFSVGLFYRIEENGGGNSYPWGGGLAMNPQGNGWYQLSLVGNNLPSISTWQHEAWLDFQFVANGPNNQAIAWSPVIRKATLWQCYV